MSRSGTADGVLEDVERWVVDHLTRSHVGGVLGVEDLLHVAPHPDGLHVACTAVVRPEPMAATRQRVLVADLVDGTTTWVELDADCHSPAWSPDGRRLAVVRASGAGATAVVLDGLPTDLSIVAESDPSGFVESARWSPDGMRLALQVAMPGAEISDVYGSGTLGGSADPWRPRVLPAVGLGRRQAQVWDPRTGDLRVVVPRLSVWELVWNGDRALLAVASEQADEDAWYGAFLARLSLDEDVHERLLVPDDQLSVPRSSPAGRRWSVLSGLQSDRGLPAGQLLVAGTDGAPRPVDTGGVHVTDQHWLDEDTVVVAGLRGLRTVFATIRVGNHDGGDGDSVTELWSGRPTAGEFFPQVAALPGRPPIVVLEHHDDPPTLGVLQAGEFRRVLAADGPGAAYQASCSGTVTELTWQSSDGQTIEGLLTMPDSAHGPMPLVVQVHGGPTHAYRDTWLVRDPHTSCLVARGYAVLWPNPRGSSGRGPAFAEAVRGDMGGLDVDDVVSGVRHVVDLGLADPDRLGITGISYGGFMSSWVPARTGIFAASVARSPCTDWLLQHLTSNIGEFDRRFLAGEPFDPHSQYADRSPLRHASSIHTPMLLTAGQKDLATPPSQAQVLHTALRELGVETQLVLYPDEGHGVRAPATVADQCARMVAWFDLHLDPARSA